MDDRTAGVGRPFESRASEDSDTEERTQEIREEIEETRQEISETIGAIQEKLRPGNIVSEAASATGERVKNMAYSAADTAEDWWEASGGPSFLDRIRHNPVPAALAGAGLVWLAFSDGGHARRSSGYYYDRSTGRRRPYRAYDDWTEDASTRESTTSRVSSSAQSALDETRRVARRGQNRLNEMLHDNPIAVGAAAMILGAAIGLALPETERENELMGEARDNALEQAQNLAQNTVERVKDAAADAAVRAATGD